MPNIKSSTRLRVRDKILSPGQAVRMDADRVSVELAMLFSRKPSVEDFERDQIPEIPGVDYEAVASNDPDDPGTMLYYMGEGQHDRAATLPAVARREAYGLWYHTVDMNGSFGAVFNTQLLQTAPECFHNCRDRVGTIGEVYAYREWESLEEFRVVAFRKKYFYERQKPEMVRLFDVENRETFVGVELRDFPVTVAPMTALRGGLDRVYRAATRGDMERAGSDVWLALLPASDRETWSTPRPVRAGKKRRLEWQAFTDRVLTSAEAMSEKVPWMGLFHHNIEVVENSQAAWETVDPWLSKLNAM